MALCKNKLRITTELAPELSTVKSNVISKPDASSFPLLSSMTALNVFSWEQTAMLRDKTSDKKRFFWVLLLDFLTR